MFSDWRCNKCRADLMYLDPRSGKCRVCGSKRWTQWRKCWAWRDPTTGRWAVDDPPRFFSERKEDAFTSPTPPDDQYCRAWVLPDRMPIGPVTELPKEQPIVGIILKTAQLRVPLQVADGTHILDIEAHIGGRNYGYG